MAIATAEVGSKTINYNSLPMERAPQVYDLLPILETPESFIAVMPHNSPFCDPNSVCDQRVTLTIRKGVIENAEIPCDGHKTSIQFTCEQIEAIAREIVHRKEEARKRGFRTIPYFAGK